MVIVVRKDLDLRPGKMAAQVGHASVSCSLKAKKERRKWYKKWLAEGQRKIVLKVDTLADLGVVNLMAEEEKIPTVMIRDAGLTEIPPGTVTCVGVGPAPANILDQITGDLSLY